MVKKLNKKDVEKKLARVHKDMPFHESPTIRQPRSMRDRQQLWVLAGLKHLRAPVVLWCF